MWATQDTARLIESAQSARADRDMPPLRCLAVLNMADPGAAPDNAAAAEALAELSGVTLLDGLIRRRKAVANASGLGLAVTELAPRDDKACAELAQLVRNVFSSEVQFNATGEPLHDHREAAPAAN